MLISHFEARLGEPKLPSLNSGHAPNLLNRTILQYP